MAELPSGTVTLLFTDVEGSTRLVQQLGDGYGALIDEQRRLLRRAVAEAGGHEVDCRADELFAAFQRAKDGVAAAAAAQSALEAHAWPEGAPVRVRMGLHTGEPALEGGAYLGLDVSRAARICAAGHGGQTLLSQTTRELVADGSELRDLGAYPLAGLPHPERIFQLVVPGLRSDFPPLRVEGAKRRRLRGMLPRPRSRQPTLEESAWQTRTLLPSVATPLQKPLAELGGALFTGHRAAVSAERLLARIDRRRLTRSLSAQREMAVVSRRAGREAEALEAQIACVDRLLDRRQALADLAGELPSALDEALTAEGIASLRERVAAATAQLDEAVARVASTLDPLSFKLQRTRHRGVYRASGKYVVPFSDELGGERRREFETLGEARNFRAALRLAEKGEQTEYTGLSLYNDTDEPWADSGLGGSYTPRRGREDSSGDR
ncbi:MAG TPA: adenylate/guanylate cyclase domain-containing protein [Thermoleophilaceae bacterium]|nr:adenylate/guanylate cyclase domain-containing protein [Thermoleophilaceae bacterium]